MRTFLVGVAIGLVAVVAACTNSGSSNGGGASSSSSSGGGGPDGSTGSPDGGGGPGGTAGALPASTFLYVSKVDGDHDILMAYDRTSGQTKTVTDFRGDGSDGWSLGKHYAISPDRSRIVVASLYGPTQEDVDQHLATRRLWTFAADGSDFRRLTPVWKNTSAGRTNFAIEVSAPIFSKSGEDVLFDYGEYWYEGTQLQGAAGIWSVAAAGGQLPTTFKNPSPCSLVSPSVDPSTGKVAVIHSVCVSGQGQQDGIYLYSEDGSGQPELLVASDYNTLDIMLETPRWAADGSGFVFIALTGVPDGNTTKMVRSLFVFDMAQRKASPLVVPEGDARVFDATSAPDVSALVYCLQNGDATDLHLIDLAVDPPTDTAITNDGKSCHPVW